MEGLYFFTLDVVPKDELFGKLKKMLHNFETFELVLLKIIESVNIQFKTIESQQRIKMISKVS